ncbi:MAG: hypothetical protein BGO51_24330 [Rhodospirillales bacterium 69-11]|nr:MAG: hypothetical protein BGO51_24330 [Rhodospirillales bacterium 69-11]
MAAGRVSLTETIRVGDTLKPGSDVGSCYPVLPPAVEIEPLKFRPREMAAELLDNCILGTKDGPGGGQFVLKGKNVIHHIPPQLAWTAGSEIDPNTSRSRERRDLRYAR